MYFYHEDYHGAYLATLDNLGSPDQRDEGRTYEPIRLPAILNWLVVVSVALCVLVAAILALS